MSTLVVVLGGAPVASADVIETRVAGVTVDTGAENPDGSRRIVVTAAQTQFDDRIDVRSTGRREFARDMENGAAAFIVNRDQTEVAISACATEFLSSSECLPFVSFYPYTAEAPKSPVEPASFQAPPPEDLTVEAAVAVPASGSAEVFIAARRQLADHLGTLTCDNGTRADAFVRY